MKRSLSEIILAVTIICLMSSSAPAMTSDNFRCPNGALIRVNDKLATVKMKCDPPTSAKAYYEAFEMEEWVYNLGPTSFVTYLTFRNGVLTNIQMSDEYGY